MGMNGNGASPDEGREVGLWVRRDELDAVDERVVVVEGAVATVAHESSTTRRKVEALDAFVRSRSFYLRIVAPTLLVLVAQHFDAIVAAIARFL